MNHKRSEIGKEIQTDQSLNPLNKEKQADNSQSATVSFIKHEDNPHEQSLDKLIDDLEHSKRGFIQGNEELDISQISGFKNQRSLKKQGSQSDKLKIKSKTQEGKVQVSSSSSENETPNSKILSSSQDIKPEKFSSLDDKHHDNMLGKSSEGPVGSVEMQQSLKAKHKRLGSLLRMFRQRKQSDGGETLNFDSELKILSINDFKDHKSVKDVKNSYIRDAIRKALLGNMVDISEYNINFNLTRFIKMFLYHLIFFYIGPLVGFIMWAIDGKGLVINTAFWYNKFMATSFYQQIMLWLANVSFIIMWGFNDPQKISTNSKYHLKLGGIYSEQFLFFQIQIVIRSFIVAVRYAYCSELRFSLLKSSGQSGEFISKDLLFFGWLIFNPKVGLTDEIASSLHRNQVEESMFKISLIEDLDEVVLSRLKDEKYYDRAGMSFSQDARKEEIDEYLNRIELKELMTDLGKSSEEVDHKLIYGKRYSLVHPKSEEGCRANFDKTINAKLMMREIGLFASAIQIRRKWVFLFVFFRAIIPYIVRWAEYGSPVYNFGVDSYVYSFLDLFFGTVFLLQNYIFIIAGLIDFQRRSTIMKACSAMLNPMKGQLEAKYRMFPTVMMTCTQSMHTWFQMRMCLMDLGRKYVNRIFIYSSTFLGCYLFYAILLLLQYFDLVNLQISIISQTIALYDIIFTLTNIFGMLYFGAITNEQFVEDQMLLMKQKSCLIHLKSNIEQIMNPAYEKGGIELQELGLPRINQLYLKVYQRLLFGIKRKYNYDNEQLGKRILDVVHELDCIRERLEMDADYAPLKLLGFKATFTLLNRIYTGIATLILAVVQRMMNKQSGSYN